MAANRRSVSQTWRGSRGKGVTAHIHTRSGVSSFRSGLSFPECSHSVLLLPRPGYQYHTMVQEFRGLFDSTPTVLATVVSGVKSHKCCRTHVVSLFVTEMK